MNMRKSKSEYKPTVNKKDSPLHKLSVIDQVKNALNQRFYQEKRKLTQLEYIIDRERQIEKMVTKVKYRSYRKP